MLLCRSDLKSEISRNHKPKRNPKENPTITGTGRGVEEVEGGGGGC